nr:TIGR02680 family protein [Streptomyces sp. HNM0575]
MDNLTRVARESTEQHEQAQRDQHATELQRDELQQRADELEAGIEGLKESDIYKQGEELDQLRRSFEHSARRAKRLRETADAKQLQAGEDEQHAAEAAARARECADRAREASEDAHRAARTAGLESIYQEAKTMIGTPSETSESVGDDQVARSRHLARGAAEARRGQIVEVGTAIGAHDRALSDRAAAEASLDEARDRLADAVHRRDEAIRVYEEALTKQAQLLREWAAGCVELRFDDVEALVSLTAVEDDVASLVDSAMRSVVGEIADREARTDTARGAALDERGTLTETIEALRREADLPPAAPPTRTTDRSTMAGAPLWRLVAFHDDVPVDVQAGVEAALEASGLLDAWVKPDDEVVLPGHDTWAEAAWAVPAPGASLLDVLRPEADIPVAADSISRLLGSISYGPRLPNEHLAAVGADGSWRLASATGTWVKEEPAHIGSLARERTRRRRIDQLTERLTEVNSTIATCDAQMRECRERRNRLDADLSARPRYRDLNEKRRLWDRAEEGIGVRDDALRAAAKLLEEREADVTKSLRQLSRLSTEYGLPTDRGLLKDLSSAVDTFRDMADAWADACMRWSAAMERSTSAGSQAARSLAAAQEHTEEAETADSESSGLRAKLEAVESTVGEDFRQVAARIHEMREEHHRSRDNMRLRNEDLRALDQRIGQLQATMTQDAEERDKAVSARDAAAQRFRHLSLLGLPEDAGVSGELTAQDGTRATLASARSVAAKWPNIPHEPRNVSDAATRLLETVYEARPLLGQRTDLDLEPDEDVQVFAATMDGVRVGATGLLRILTAERDSSRDDITTAERRLFDQTLTGDTRRHLAARIRQANELVDRMNGHLERVRTASNVAVQLVWQIHPDLPPGTRTARELLLKDPGRVTDADREALHAFFRSRIEEAKARNTAATWEEQLSEVLDYTAWHQLVVKLDRANGHGWQLLTKKMHGALSGGEKAIALHLPLFAAVAAHYEAVPEAPRPILLDEVFVGVDTVNRGQVFALLSALDLDLMLTSDHEWATYRELAGIAVHQLITGADRDDAVTSARFIWDGNGLEPDETEEVPA